MLNKLLWFFLAYTIGIPLFLMVISFLKTALLKRRARRKRERARQKKVPRNELPDPGNAERTNWWGAIRKRVGFTLKDTRVMPMPFQLTPEKRDKKQKRFNAKNEKLKSKGKEAVEPKKGSKDGETAKPKMLPLSNRGIFLTLYVVGLVVMLVPAFVEAAPASTFVLLSLMVFVCGLIFSFYSSQRVLKVRERVIKTMAEIAKEHNLGPKAERGQNLPPSAYVKVTEWAEPARPSKIEIPISTSFRENGQESFMRHFNQFHGVLTTWVEDVDKNGEGGFSYQDYVAKLRAVPPLPTLAPWDEHYILAEGVSKDFFPIGLGVEKGLELPNPKTKEIEHVIGFDVSGNVAKTAKKFGLNCDPLLDTASPHAYICGGTGGGKALSSDTLVPVLVPTTANASAEGESASL